MSLRARVLAVTLVATLALAGLLHFLVPPLWLGAFHEVEHQFLRDHVTRVKGAVEADLDALQATALDWAVWDDTFDYLRGEKPEFVAANLNIDTTRNLHIEALAILARDGSLSRIQWGVPEEEAPLDADALFREAGERGLLPAEAKGSRGVTSIGKVTYLAVSQPVTRTDGSGDSPGTVLLLRRVDPVALSTRLRSTVTVLPLADLGASGPFSREPASGPGGEEGFVEDCGLFPAPGPRAEIGFTVRIPDDVARTARAALGWLQFGVIATCFLLGFVAWGLLSRFVVRRAEAVSRSVAAVAGSADLSRRLPESGDDEFGAMVKGVNAMLDALQRAEVERESARRALMESEMRARESQKLEAVGQLAGGIAHDFNNLLVVVIGYADLIERAAAGDPDLPSHARAIREAGERAASLTQQLLAFSRRQPAQPQVVDPVAFLRRSSDTLRRLLGSTIAISIEAAEGTPNIRVDPSQWLQVVLNLLLNARDAMPGGGTVAIALEPVPAPATPSLRMTVTDAGTGIPVDILPRVFEPFFTTKELGRGSGLGLSTVHGIIHQHGGRIRVENADGGGARFVIEMPGVDEAAPPEPPRPGESAASAGVGPTAPAPAAVLLVEDEPAVRRLARTALENAGFRVLEAAHAAEALALDEALGGDLGTLVTDIVMPGMDGFELARVMKARHPALSMIFMSGFTPEVPAGGIPGPFLQKPFSPAELVRLVRGMTTPRELGTVHR